jgi:hypothetical protein
MRTIFAGTGRRKQLRDEDCVRVGQRNGPTAFPRRITKTANPALKLGMLMAKAGAAKLIPDKDFCLDDFPAKQDTGIVSGSKG